LFDSWTLLLGLIFSSIGLVYFVYGKKRTKPVARYCGLALMVYPYFIDDKMIIVIVGLILMALPKFIKTDPTS